MVSETIFSQFMYKMLPSCNHLFIFKKQLCLQLALSGAAPSQQWPALAGSSQVVLLLSRGHLHSPSMHSWGCWALSAGNNAS